MAGFVQKGLKNILQKNPQDVVFLSALRTPITRAKKGGLRDAYDHELLAAVSSAMKPPSNHG
jgi:acetyl-CoA acyltransferase 1